jgi:hypothetical protein
MKNLIFYLKPLQNFNCNVTEATGRLNDYKIITNVYVNCPKLSLQIAILYERKSFLWIGADENEIGKPKWFGDVPRALQT